MSSLGRKRLSEASWSQGKAKEGTASVRVAYRKVAKACGGGAAGGAGGRSVARWVGNVLWRLWWPYCESWPAARRRRFWAGALDAPRRANLIFSRCRLQAASTEQNRMLGRATWPTPPRPAPAHLQVSPAGLVGGVGGRELVEEADAHAEVGPAAEVAAALLRIPARAGGGRGGAGG